MMLKHLVNIVQVRRAKDLRSAIEHLMARLVVARTMTITIDTALFHENTLTPKAKQQILMVIRKRFRHIVKYANATEISVSLNTTGQRAYLVIRDNGKGGEKAQTWTGLFISDIVGSYEMNKVGSVTTIAIDTPAGSKESI